MGIAIITSVTVLAAWTLLLAAVVLTSLKGGNADVIRAWASVVRAFWRRRQ